MALMNENFLKLKHNDLFVEIAKRTSDFKKANPGKEIIKLGIGDTTLPLVPSVVTAIKKAAEEMGTKEGARGYGPETGYNWLKKTIAAHDYRARGIDITQEEIVLSEGAKNDTTNFLNLFGAKASVAITDPVYPSYLDAAVISGRAGNLKNGKYGKIIYLPCTAANNFSPALPKKRADIIYLCLPNNPTGTVLTREALEKWVAYAKENKSILLCDAAYEAYITNPDIPRSIYEIPGAKEVAVEFRSLSKTAGFTGVRFAYSVVPKEIKVYAKDGSAAGLRDLWFRHQAMKLNGVSYIIQKAAEAVYSEQGQKETKETVAYYMENAKIIREAFKAAGIKAYGGVDAPYIWLKLPRGLKSWDFFDKLLKETAVVGTPGAGFGPHGEGYFRLSAFGDREKTKEAVERIKNNLKI